MSPFPTPFVPADFILSQRLETNELRLRMLTINDVVKDYDAVMTSVEHLRTVGPKSGRSPISFTPEIDPSREKACHCGSGTPRLSADRARDPLFDKQPKRVSELARAHHDCD
jgi:hypothetical protein